MEIKNGIKGDLEKKSQKERKEKNEIEAFLHHQKKKEMIRKNIEVESDLFQLQEIITTQGIDNESSKIIQKVIDHNNVTPEELKVIFDKIDAIENKEDIHAYLPKDYQVTKNEYMLALGDNEQRQKLILKLNGALAILAHNAQFKGRVGVNLFAGLLTVLDKNLLLLQENHIDIKRSLQVLENNNHLSAWEKFIKILREIFT